MNITCVQKATVIYYNNNSLELMQDSLSVNQGKDGRIILPGAFKQGKSIIAVFEGECKMLNKLGDRIISNMLVA
ncbi:TIGR02922 family protein [Colwelliaceae bacterium BS250]